MHSVHHKICLCVFGEEFFDQLALHERNFHCHYSTDLILEKITTDKWNNSEISDLLDDI